MNKNKFIILIIAFCVVIILLFFVVSNINQNKSLRPSGSQPSSSTDTPTQNPPSATTPSPLTSPADDKNIDQSNDNIIKVDDPNDKTAIKNAFAQFKDAPMQDFGWTDIKDSKNNDVSLDNFSQAIGMNISPEIDTLLDKSKFDLFSCPSKDEVKNIGMVIDVKLLPNYSGDLYKDEVKFMKNWESTILKDTWKVFFSDADFATESIEQKLIFKDGKYRYAEVSLPDGSKSSINYDIWEDFIVVSNSPDCMSSAANQLLDFSN